MEEHDPKRARDLSTTELVKEVVREVGQLARTQVELAATEARADLRAGLGAFGALGVAAVAALLSVNLLLATAVLALARVLPGWAAGLIVSGGVAAVALVAGVIGWRRRVREPLKRTRRALEEDARWAKHVAT
ncbi:MAG TPA: phage holin family protein [Polyangia bacterium]|nr:phage holin family protein [Polyangia bacterium]